jgi:flagellar basal body-associated protein FliL
MADKKESKDAKDAKAGKDAGAETAAAPSKKKGLILGAAGVAVALALAFAASLMAVPHKEHAPHLEGPFVAKLSKDQIQANLARAGGKRYVAMLLQAEYYAYSEAYVQGRLGGGGDGHGGAGAEDPLYLAMLKDALLTVAGTKTAEEITDTAMTDVFLEEVREAVDPVLFPVYIGTGTTPYRPDKDSGLKVGEDHMRSTMRGLLHEHALKVDAAAKTIALDGGSAVPFTNHDRNLKVINQAGECVYVDCTLVNPEFSGAVPVGVPGRVRRIFKDALLVQ